MSKPKKIKQSTRNLKKAVSRRDTKQAEAVSKESAVDIEESVTLQAMSIRVDHELIETFKQIAHIHHMAYQPLMREALRRFADAQMKSILTAVADACQEVGQQGGKNTIEVKLEHPYRRTA